MADWHKEYEKAKELKKFNKQKWQERRRDNTYSFLQLVVECMIAQNIKINIFNLYYNYRYKLDIKVYHPNWKSFVVKSETYESIVINDYLYYESAFNMYLKEFLKEKYKLPFLYFIPFRASRLKLRKSKNV